MDDWQLLRKEKDEVTEWKLFKVTNESYEVTIQKEGRTDVTEKRRWKEKNEVTELNCDDSKWRNDGRDDSKWRNENVWFESDGTEVIEKRRKEKDEMT